MIDRKFYWLTILALLAANSHCDQLKKLYLPTQNGGTSGGSLFLMAPDPVTAEARVNKIASYEHEDPRNLVKPQEQNIFHEPALEFGPQVSSTKFMNSGELPTGSFGQQPTDDFNAIFIKSTMPERPERHQALFDRLAKTVHHHNYYNDGDQFMYNLESDHGITADVKGSASNGVESEGGYAYTGDAGNVYSVRYQASKNGFNPRGRHLPTSPPIPIEILRGHENNAKDEANGIYDDGSYDPHKYPGSYHYDPVPGTTSNDAVDNVNNHNHIHSHSINNDLVHNQASAVYTDSAVDMHFLQGNNNVENLNAIIDDAVVTDAPNPNSFLGFRSLEAAARIGGVDAPPPSRNRYKGAQYLPPVSMSAQHLDIGAPNVVGSPNRRVMLTKPSKYDVNKPHKAIVLPRAPSHGY